MKARHPASDLESHPAVAPAFDDINITTDIVDSRCAAEYITPTFLPCILIGLSQAPKISFNEGFSIDDLDFLITPYNCLGGIPMLEACKRNLKIYAIKENKTVLNIEQYNLSLKCDIINTYKDLMELI